MAEAKTIKLLLSNGSLSGLLMAELLKWEGILFSSPRASYQLLSNEPESKYWGVYLLVSDNQVYIGQANDLLRRIGEHDKSKDWWNKVVLLTTKDNSLNRSDIDYLENKLINIAKSIGTLEMNNVQVGNSPKVSRYRETELADFLEGGLLLLELIGIKVVVISQKVNLKDENTLTSGLDDNASKKTSDTNLPKNTIQTLNKRQAINYLENNFNMIFEERNITFASLQVKLSTYWANPHIDLLNHKWYLILNNQLSKELILLEIPPRSFSIDSSLEYNRLLTRSDKPYYIDLNIDKSNFIDTKSKCNFSRYVKKVFKY